MGDFLFPAIFEDLNLFRFEISDELAFAVSNYRVDLNQVSRDLYDIVVVRFLRLLRRRRRRRRAWLLRECRRSQQKQVPLKYLRRMLSLNRRLAVEKTRSSEKRWRKST